MIFGIGTDIVAIERLERMWNRHGARATEKILGPEEIPAFEAATHKGRFLAKRFAAKEAFAKAIGTGVRPPVVLTAIVIDHDALGKPVIVCRGALAALVDEKRLSAQLSISDEANYAVAFVVLEQV